MRRFTLRAYGRNEENNAPISRGCYLFFPPSLMIRLLGLLILGPAAMVLADEIVPQRPISPQSRVLEGLVGTWDTQVSGGSEELSANPVSLGCTTREWVVDHHVLHERGSEHEAFITFDRWQNGYRAWYFHSNGHVWEMTGRWTGSTDRLALSAELDENQTLTRNFQLLGDKHQECTITWTDEDGRIGVYGMFNFTRCDPILTDKPGKNPNTVSPPKTSPPAEMKIFERSVGKWALEATMTSGGKTTKATVSNVVQWILGGQFLLSKSTIEGRIGETINVTGFDAATKTYRGWYFDADNTASEPAVGTWDEKQNTMTWKYRIRGDLVLVNQKHWINRDTSKIHGVCSRQDGSVYWTQDGTFTRQKD